MNAIELRHYRPADDIDSLAVAAFEQFRHAYTDWPVCLSKIAAMSSLSAHADIIVAQRADQLLGAVAYIGPHRPKSDFFDPAWPIMRMLVVAPQARGMGIGRSLALACIARARRDGASVFALHTSELMTVALPMYRRMGFEWHTAAPAIHGVEYGIYLKDLER